MNHTFTFKQIQLAYDSASRRIHVTTPTTTWSQLPSHNEKILLTLADQSYEFLLDDACSIVAKPFKDGLGEGIQTLFSGFQINGHLLDLTLETRVWLDTFAGKIHFDIHPIHQGDFLITHLFWPAPFEFAEQKDSHYTVIPIMQGYVIPNNYARPIDIPYDKVFYERAAYMPWWGQIKDNNGFIAIATTPWDGAYELSHPANGPTTVKPYWRSSLGQLSYARKLVYTFLANCDYNDLCKVYRQYIKEKGELVTLKEKIAKNPKVAELIGSCIVHTGGWYHAVPDSQMYDHENPTKNDEWLTFKQVEEGIEQLKTSHDIHKLYLHLDGWGKRGYDNLHPDIWPPAEKLGGLPDLKSLETTCHACGYLLGIHDQYRDYYLDAETFTYDHAIHDQNLKSPYCDTWHGGKHTYLCATLAPDYIKRNYTLFDQNDIHLDGSYLDVFSVVNLDECFHTTHPMTRKDCMVKRSECLNYIRSRGMIVSSEEVTDWALPYLELCHHAPFRVDASNTPFAPVAPLFTLVYHDCIVVPWSSIKGDWYIPNGDHPSLYALLYGGISYLDLEPTSKQVENSKFIAELHTHIAHAELLRHEFLTPDRRIQRTYFSDGTIVEVNFDTDTYSLTFKDQIISGTV